MACGHFCACCPARHAVVASLPQTLGSAQGAIQIHRCATDLHLRPVCIQPWSKSGRLPTDAIQMRRCPTCLRSRLFAVRRQLSPASTVSGSPPKSLSPPRRSRSCSRRDSLWFRHVVPPPVANQRAPFNALRAALPKCLLGGALRRCPLRVSTVVRHLPVASRVIMYQFEAGLCFERER